jgi:hypothetical protein
MAEGFGWEQNWAPEKENDRRDDATSGKNDTGRNYPVLMERIDMEMGRWCICRQCYTEVVCVVLLSRIFLTAKTRGRKDECNE